MFQGVLKSVSAKYTMFNSDGTPSGPRRTISLEEVPTDPKKTNPTRVPHAGRRVVVGAGDSLHSIAYAEFGTPTLWRGLAQFNGIDDPLRVPPGTRLLIPTADEAVRSSAMSLGRSTSASARRSRWTARRSPPTWRCC